MSVHVLRNSFNAGEISPLMNARTDAERFNFSCRKLENFIPKIYGGAFRRPGTVYLGTVGDGASEVMLIGFNISATTTYVLELGDTYLRVWNADGTPFIDELTSPYTDTLELTTPYAAADLFELQFVALNNVCFFTHPDYPPQKLTRTYDEGFAAYSFTWAAVSLTYPCFRTTNQTATQATPDGTTGTIDIDFDADIFTETLDYSQYVGAKIQLYQKRTTSYVEKDLNNTSGLTVYSSELYILGDFSLYTYNNWDGTLTLQRENAAGVFEDVRTFTSEAADSRTIVYTGTAETGANYRFSWAGVAGTDSPRALLEAEDSRQAGIVEIDSIAYSGGLPTATCTVIEDLATTDATTEWALEAWADYSGYPRAIAFHEQRLWFGGTELEPNTFWASYIDDFLNFRRGAYDSDALSFTLAAQEGSAIQSILSHEALVIFTQTEEWTASTSENTTITPSNIFVRRQSRFGSAFRQSFIANNSILFLQRGSRKLRAFTYSGTEAGGSSEDLSVLAEHITEGGIKQVAYQQHPDPIIWCVTNDGELLSVTYELTQNVIAWAKHTTTGTVESVAVIYGDSTDEVWIVANRDGGRYVERLDPNYTTQFENDNLEEMIFVDSAVTVSGSSNVSTVGGLDHLEGETVAILADGYVQPSATVSGGEVSLSSPASKVVVGLPFTSELQPSKTEIPLQDGTSFDRTFSVDELAIDLWKSKTFEYGDAENSDFFDDALTTEGDMELYTGLLRQVKVQASYRDNINVTLRQSLPLPLNVLAIVARVAINGD